MAEIPLWQQPTYDPKAVQPMRDELIAVGFEELLTPEAVDDALGQQDDKTVLLVINSVCGCAAGSARPGVCEALQHSVIPDRLVTSFAGQDKLAVAHIREKYLSEYPPSSPSIFLFKNGQVLFAMHRYMIEGRMPGEIAEMLKYVFEQHCSRKGPSVPPEHYEKVVHARSCGSKIPRYEG
ncbi:MAG: BrxA/BrxB family bacilliredoxin [Calditrichaeota bacterium]|nr:MAG: BrxA/BrxB family bacilliredoxin [Calditrichota bacterium]